MTMLIVFDDFLDTCTTVGIEDNSNLPFHCLWALRHSVVATACIALFYQTGQSLVNLLGVGTSHHQQSN